MARGTGRDIFFLYEQELIFLKHTKIIPSNINKIKKSNRKMSKRHKQIKMKEEILME
jgi:hypothetical protein